MTSDAHADPPTDTAADPADVRTPPEPAAPAARWSGFFASPLRAASVAVAATLVLVAGPCLAGAFVLGVVAGSHGWQHGDSDRGDRRIDDRYGRPGVPGDERGRRLDDRRNGKDPMAPPATVAPPATPTAVVPAPNASN
jgi:hypothetical protein